MTQAERQALLWIVLIFVAFSVYQAATGKLLNAALGMALLLLFVAFTNWRARRS